MYDETPSNPEWKALYSAAVKFKKLKPWKWMGDRDIFGVQNLETGTIGYCCVMGNAGEHFDPEDVVFNDLDESIKLLAS